VSVAGKILTFLPSHPPLINSFLTDEIFFGRKVEEEEVEKKIDEIFPNCCIRGVTLKQGGGD
jgi:hypothetical protein